MTKEDYSELAAAAIRARQMAYAPYSRFLVGAALLDGEGRIWTGCNVENASYPAGSCAERNAICKAVSEGVREIKAIAICGAPQNNPVKSVVWNHSGKEDRSGDACATGENEEYPECPPCGICRQVMREFGHPDLEIVLVKSARKYRVLTLEELLPESFGPEHL
jgi:cytidine deaminase